MDDDAALVGRARSGDPDAFGALLRRHGGLVRAVAASVLGDPGDAEDAAQDALIRAWSNLDLLVDPARFVPWLARIAFAAAIDARRRRRPTVALDALASAADPAPGADELLATRRLEQAVRAAIAALPPRYRRPLVLYHLDGLRHDRIAAALGVEPGTARSLVTRARDRLRALLAAAPTVAAPALDDLLADARPRAVLHVVNGDCTREPLERAGVPGRVTVQADALTGGPCPPRWGPAWWDARAGFHGEPDARAVLEAWDRALDDAAAHDEVVLWFEHDVFDQLLLARVLALLARQPRTPRLSIVSIDRHPARPRFKSLGELTPDQLASLHDTRAPLGAGAIALGCAAWDAITAPDPRPLAALAARPDPALPFLAPALRRFLEDLPGARDGLTRTERTALALVGAGAATRAALWAQLHDAEERHYVTDRQLDAMLARLTAPPAPLLAGDEPYALTPIAHDVLAGRVDWIALTGIDRWHGGVRLDDPARCWRWDPLLAAPVS